MLKAPWWLLAVAIGGVLLVGAQWTSAQDTGVQTELKTAITHAGFAEKYDSMKEVGLHLHHVVNCLVGAGDPMYDKASGDPCQGQGNGVLADVKAKMGEDQEYQVVWWMARLGSDAIKMGNLAQAKAAAHIINVQLTSIAKM